MRVLLGKPVLVESLRLEAVEHSGLGPFRACGIKGRHRASGLQGFGF